MTKKELRERIDGKEVVMVDQRYDPSLRITSILLWPKGNSNIISLKPYVDSYEELSTYLTARGCRWSAKGLSKPEFCFVLFDYDDDEVGALPRVASLKIGADLDIFKIRDMELLSRSSRAGNPRCPHG